MKHRESLWGNSTSQSKGVFSNGREKQLRQSSCSSSLSASNSTHRTVWALHIHLLTTGPRTQAPRHLASFKVPLILTMCAGLRSSSSEEFCSGGSSLPSLCSGPIPVLRWLPLSLINRHPARRRHPAFPGRLAQQSGRWSPLPR